MAAHDPKLPQSPAAPSIAGGLIFQSLVALVLMVGVSWYATVVAQPYPAKSIRLIVPFPPGGPNDVFARILGQKLSEGLGQQFVIDNRGGAGGTIGAGVAAKSPADGYTLFLGSAATLAIAPSLYGKLDYDAVRSFAPISLVAFAPYIIAVHAGLPVSSLQELIDYARSRPGQIHYGSAGNGTPPHIAGEMFKAQAGVNLVHVPYRGGAAEIIDLVAGRVEVMFGQWLTFQQHIRAGKIRVLAVASGKRYSLLPDVPTAREAGLPGYEVAAWYGFLAPVGTPTEAIRRVNSELLKALVAQDVRDSLANQGVEPSGSSPEQFAALISDELERWSRAVRASGAKLD